MDKQKKSGNMWKNRGRGRRNNLGDQRYFPAKGRGSEWTSGEVKFSF